MCTHTFDKFLLYIQVRTQLFLETVVWLWKTKSKVGVIIGMTLSLDKVAGFLSERIVTTIGDGIYYKQLLHFASLTLIIIL